jgi:cytochrome c553
MAFLVLLVVSQAIRPAGTNPPTDAARTLAANVPLPAGAAEVIDRACRDCHSNDTRWPWYSNVAPMSWFLIDHVNDGRRRFNYSRWTDYDAKHQREFLKDACEEARKHDMPLPSYTWIHTASKLSDRDIRTLCDWTSAALRASD